MLDSFKRQAATKHFISIQRRALLWVLAAVALTPAVTWSQATNHGAVAGTVIDSSGAAVVGADVTATNSGTGTVYKVKTGSSGDYRFVDLQVGTYSISVNAASFKGYVTNGVVVDVSTTRTLDITLQLGSVNENVTVNAESLSLETQSSDVGQVITTEQVLDLPLALGGVGATRSPEAFVFLVPGTTGPGTNNGAGGVFESKVSGGQNFGTEILLDGASMDRSENGSSFDEAGPSVEAIGQFKVITSTPTADYGRSTGGWESFYTKAGTNSYHGHVYELLQNEDFNANSWFNNVNHTPRPPDKKNDYGLTLGGPVQLPKIYNGRDKTFFFFSWEQFRQNLGTTVLSTVPTVAERNGDFSEFLGGQLKDASGNPILNPCTGQPILQGQIFDPSTTTVVAGTPCRLPFANNQITNINPIATNILALIPAPQNSNTTGNFNFTSSAPVNDTLMTVRLDHSIGYKNKFYFTYNSRDNTHAPISSQYGGPATPGPQTQDFFTHYIRVGWDHSLTSSLLNQLVVGFNRTVSVNFGSSRGKNWDAALGITGLPPSEIFPVINFNAGIDNAGYNVDGNTVDNGYRINDSLSWVKGRHTLKFGTDLRLQVFNAITNDNASGTFNFGAGETAPFPGAANTGNGFASFLLGEVDNANAAIHAGQPKWIQHYYGFYLQDDWKIKSNLTLNLGLRWDVDTPRREKSGAYTNLSLTTPNPAADGFPGALVFAGVGPGRNGNVDETWAGTYYKDVGPRVGFAWSPGLLKDKGVIRGGYSIYYGPIVYAEFGAGGLRQGFTGGLNPALASSPDQGFTPAFNISSGVPPFTPPPNFDPAQENGGGPFYIDPSNGRPAMIQNWSLELQHKLPAGFFLDIAYVGQHATHLRSQFDQIDTLNPFNFALGNLLTADINSPQAVAAGISKPYPSFGGTVAQALRPFPQYTFINTDCCLENQGQSTYNALEVSVQHRFKNGLNMLASYTFSKTITDAADSLLPAFANFAGGGTPQNPYDHKGDKSISTQDIPHQVVLSYVYELPVGRGKKFLDKGGVVDRVVGGWQIGAVQRYQSGQPLSFGCATGIPAFNGCVRFDLVPGEPLTSVSVRNGTYNPVTAATSPGCVATGDGHYTGGENRYFNCAAFFDPNATVASTPGQPYRLGDLPRVVGSVRSGKYFNEDFSLNKRTRITERTDILFSTDFLNAFNRHVFARPITSGPGDINGFGVIQTTAYPSAFTNSNSFGRIIQFTLKVEF
jgi:hypothetical protein